MPIPFRHVTVLGVGLVGGSFALALRRAFPEVSIAGWDREEVLERARQCGAIDDARAELAAACRGADLVYLALPVEETLRRLPEIAAAAPPEALVTDSASTKAAVCEAAGRAFVPPRFFLGGHPVAGREQGGIANASPDLFRGAPYALMGASGESDARAARLAEVVAAIGARAVWLDPAEHDRLFAYLSHLPQLASIALAETVLAGAGDAARLLAGPGLGDSTRLAGSPYELWAGICRTSPQLDEALVRLIESLEGIRARLRDPSLAQDFDRAARLYKILRQME